jgi:hypothetical protein
VLSSNTGWKMAIHCLTYKNLLVLNFLHIIVLLVYSTGSGHQTSQFDANNGNVYQAPNMPSSPPFPAIFAEARNIPLSGNPPE